MNYELYISQYRNGRSQILPQGWMNKHCPGILKRHHQIMTLGMFGGQIGGDRSGILALAQGQVALTIFPLLQKSTENPAGHIGVIEITEVILKLLDITMHDLDLRPQYPSKKLGRIT